MRPLKAFLQRHALASYFGIVFLLSWGSGLVVLGPKLVRGETIPALDALLLFPVLVIGVGLTGLVLTALVDGRTGVRALFSRMCHWRVDAQWYLAALLIPPLLILAVLLALRNLVSPNFVPNFFPVGILFGLIPGFFEEIGWTGYALPRMQSGRSSLAASLVLGVLWGIWHVSVVDTLGAAAPHRASWLPFFLAFVALLTAMRVLIAWVYASTASVLLAQLMHASSTGSLVVLGAAHTSPAQEALWYAVYAAVLWVVVALVTARYGVSLIRQSLHDQAV